MKDNYWWLFFLIAVVVLAAAAGCSFDKVLTEPNDVSFLSPSTAPPKSIILTLADGSRYQLGYISHHDYYWEYYIETLPKLTDKKQNESKNLSRLEFWLASCVTIIEAGGSGVVEVKIIDNYLKVDFNKNFTKGTVWFLTKYVRQGGGSLLAVGKAGQFNNSQNPVEIYGPYCHNQGSAG